MLVALLLRFKDQLYKKLFWMFEVECYELIRVGISKMGLPDAELIEKKRALEFFFVILKARPNRKLLRGISMNTPDQGKCFLTSWKYNHGFIIANYESCGNFLFKDDLWYDIDEKGNLTSKENNTNLPKVFMSPDNT